MSDQLHVKRRISHAWDYVYHCSCGWVGHSWRTEKDADEEFDTHLLSVANTTDDWDR